MKLSMKDRAVLINATLPPVGNYEYLLVRKDILDKVRITQEEIKKYNFKTDPDGATTWDCDAEFDYEFSDLERETIRKELTDLSKKKKLKAAHMGIYKLFVVMSESQESK